MAQRSQAPIKEMAIITDSGETKPLSSVKGGTDNYQGHYGHRELTDQLIFQREILARISAEYNHKDVHVLNLACVPLKVF